MMSAMIDALLLDEFQLAALELGKQRTLYHYTNKVGLQGILSSGVIRASSYRSVNDASELRLGRHFVSEVLDSLIPTLPRRRNELAEVREKLNEDWTDVLDRQVLDVYITSFCGDVDRLSQWRAYGTSSGRYAIALEARKLDGVGFFQPMRVLYDEDEQRRSVRAVVERILARADTCNATLEDVELALRLKLFELTCRIKHQGFHEENEWRSIVDASGYEADDLIRFPPPDVPSPRPFVDLIRGSSDGPHLPITSVFVGPSREKGESVRLAHDLLEQNGYDGVEVIISEIPLID